MYLLKRLIGAESIKPRFQSGKLSHSFGRRGAGKGQFSNHCGIAVTRSGNIIIADTENHRVQIFNEDGHFISKFGSKGPAPDQFNCPINVAVTNADDIIVTDTVNGRVKRFSQSGSLLQILAEDDTFEHPHGLSVSYDDWIIVTDICLNKLTLLSPHGSVSKSTGCYGDGPSEFDHPHFVQFTSRKEIVVADHGNVSVKIFNFDLQPIRTFSMQNFKLYNETFLSIQGLCVDDQQNVLLVGNCTIYILANDGRLWEVILPKEGLYSPRCIAYRAGRLFVTQSGVGHCAHEVSIFVYNQNDYKSLKLIPALSQLQNGGPPPR